WAAALAELGDLEGALLATQRAARADPLRESPYREQMRLYAALGRAPAALDTYHDLERRFKKELGVAPAAATRALAEQIQRDPDSLLAGGAGRWVLSAGRSDSRPSEPSTQHSAPGPPPPTPSSLHSTDPVLPPQWTRFFGRERELARLQELLA